jgi:transcriptional regulator with XRE-family HTH domain
MAAGSKKADSYDVTLGAAIRERRRAAGLSLRAVADRCRLSVQQVHKYETGVTRMPFSRLVQIARALRWPLSELVAAVDDQARAPVGRDLAERSRALGARELLKAYALLPPGARRPLIALVEQMAAGPPSETSLHMTRLARAARARMARRRLARVPAGAEQGPPAGPPLRGR